MFNNQQVFVDDCVLRVPLVSLVVVIVLVEVLVNLSPGGSSSHAADERGG
jgi:hypothetical protein